MNLLNFRDIQINWKAFESMSDNKKSRALQNLLAVLSKTDYRGECVLLSLHASGLIDIDFYTEAIAGDWDYWCELLHENYEKIENEEDC